jgi:hypothetical protein
MSDQAVGTAYEADFAAWATEQAELLRAGRFSDLDVENLAEEVESMGRRQRRELESRLSVLMAHLTKWQIQPDLRSRSWTLTIRNQRDVLGKHLAENPSLRPRVPDAIGQAWPGALAIVEGDTAWLREMLPVACPWTPDQVLDASFLPE